MQWIENIYSEILELIEKSINLKPWLKIADSKIEHGKIVINYHQGKISSYDICPRERIYLKKNNIIK